MHKIRVTLTGLMILMISAFALTVASPMAVAQRAPNLTISWTILLHGPAIYGLTPIGNSSYDVEHGFQSFEADCDSVNLPDGTPLDVFVNGKKVGSIQLLDQGGALMLTGRRTPKITKGTTVSFHHQNGPAILTGKY